MTYWKLKGHFDESSVSDWKDQDLFVIVNDTYNHIFIKENI